MSRALFPNLPVTDLPRAKAYFQALGFEFNDQFSDETAACLVIVPDVACVMLLTHDKYRQFTSKPIADARAASGVMLAVSLESRGAVDTIAEAAFAHGGTAARPPEDLGFMYTRAIDDPEGYTWEYFHMDMLSPARRRHRGHRMAHVDGFLIPVPQANKQAFVDMAQRVGHVRND